MLVSIYSLDELIVNDILCDALRNMSLSSESLYSMYGSLDWLKSVRKLNDDIKIVVCNNNDNELLNVMPIRDGISQIDILACEPYGQIGHDGYVEMFDGIFCEFKNATCIHIKSIDYESDVFKSIRDASLKSNKYFCCFESLPRKLHTLIFKESFDDHLRLFNKKERYNLKRQCRLAAESVEGDLELVPIDSPRVIDFFVKSAKDVLQNSWKTRGVESGQLFSEKRCLEYSSLAENGLLRSYVLLGKGEPWAFVLGYQWQGVYHYANIAYNINKSEYSPGTVLFFMMLEDLYKNNKPKVLNFGIGESSYKRRFGTDESRDCTLLIMRNTYINKVKYHVQNNYSKVKTYIKNKLITKKYY